MREAVDLAIDRPALAEVSMEGLGRPVNQMVTPGIFGYNEKLPELRPNVQRARQLLAEAGYPNGFKIGFHFTNDRLPGDRAVGTSVAQMLARIGLEVQANGQPAAVLFPGRTRGDYSFVMSGWGTITGEAHYTLSSLGHSNNPQLKMGAFNWRGYSNPDLDKLLQQAATELDEGKRRALLEDAGALFMKERVSLPLVAISLGLGAAEGQGRHPEAALRRGHARPRHRAGEAVRISLHLSRRERSSRRDAPTG